jgi:hypothetical protein
LHEAGQPCWPEEAPISRCRSGPCPDTQGAPSGSISAVSVAAGVTDMS